MYFTPQAAGFDNKRDYLSQDFRNLEKPELNKTTMVEIETVPVKRGPPEIINKLVAKKPRNS